MEKQIMAFDAVGIEVLQAVYGLLCKSRKVGNEAFTKLVFDQDDDQQPPCVHIYFPVTAEHHDRVYRASPANGFHHCLVDIFTDFHSDNIKN